MHGISDRPCGYGRLDTVGFGDKTTTENVPARTPTPGSITNVALRRPVFFSCRRLIKANNGNPCGDSKSRRKTGRCVHAAIVAVYIYHRDKIGLGGGVDLELDGDMDGMEFGPEGGVWGDEHSTGNDVGFASSTQRTDPTRFKQQMAQLTMICSVYKFPVDEPEFKEGTYGRDTIHINGCICTGCGNPYERLSDADAILVGQVGNRVEQ